MSDDNKRKQYDTFSSAGFGGTSGASGAWDFNGFANGFNGAEFDFSDVFEQFFSGGSRREAKVRNRGRDIEMRVDITLEEAFGGECSVMFGATLLTFISNHQISEFDESDPSVTLPIQ